MLCSLRRRPTEFWPSLENQAYLDTKLRIHDAKMHPSWQVLTNYAWPWPKDVVQSQFISSMSPLCGREIVLCDLSPKQGLLVALRCIANKGRRTNWWTGQGPLLRGWRASDDGMPNFTAAFVATAHIPAGCGCWQQGRRGVAGAAPYLKQVPPSVFIFNKEGHWHFLVPWLHHMR